MNNKFNKLCSFPNWKPELWNVNIPDNIKDYTNCYSYALNDINLDLVNICKFDYCKRYEYKKIHMFFLNIVFNNLF